MDILAEYKKCLKLIRVLQSETGKNSGDLEKYTSDAKNAAASIEMLKVQMQSASESQTRRKLSELITARRDEINGKIDEIDRKIQAVIDNATQEKQKVISQITLQQFPKEIAIVNQARAVLSQGAGIIENSVPQSILASVQNAVIQDTNVYDLTVLTGKVEDLFDKVPDTVDVSIFKKVVKGIMLDTAIFKNWKPRTRMFVYILWMAVLVALLVYAPFVVIVPYSLLLIGSLISNVGRSKKLMNFCYPYKLLEERTTQLMQDLNQRVETSRGQRYVQINQQRDIEVAKLREERQKWQQQFDEAEMDIRSKTSVGEIAEKVQADYRKKIEDAQKLQEQAKKAFDRTQKFIAANKRQYEATLARKEELKKQVQEYYLSPTTPGTSKLLTSSFFLGMDSQEELIEFDYRGITTLIIYRGENSTVNAPLITMMLMQLLASMSIVSLKLVITDVHNACASYAQFSPPTLSSRIRLCATDEEVKTAVEEFHVEMITRNTTILTEAPSIEDYNKQMLDRKSLTREYCLLFLQDPDFKLLASQKFLQLCRSGPKVGIVPLVFLSHTNVNKMKEENDNVLDGLLSFMEIVSENAYSFNGSTQDLVVNDAGVCQVIDDLRRAQMSKG